MESKYCSTCLTKRSINEFYNNTYSPDGKYSKCKACAKKITKKYREKNKEKLRESKKKYALINREKIKKSRAFFRKKNPERYKLMVKKANKKYYKTKKRKDCLKRYYEKNKENILKKSKKRNDSLRSTLDNKYIKNLITGGGRNKILRFNDIPEEFVDLYRDLVKLRREIKNV